MPKEFYQEPLQMKHSKQCKSILSKQMLSQVYITVTGVDSCHTKGSTLIKCLFHFHQILKRCISWLNLVILRTEPRRSRQLSYILAPAKDSVLLIYAFALKENKPDWLLSLQAKGKESVKQDKDKEIDVYFQSKACVVTQFCVDQVHHNVKPLSSKESHFVLLRPIFGQIQSKI